MRGADEAICATWQGAWRLRCKAGELRNFCGKSQAKITLEHGPRLRLSRRKEALCMRILIVEDEVGLAHYISRALLEAGHDPVLAHDGETALGEVQGGICHP